MSRNGNQKRILDKKDEDEYVDEGTLVKRLRLKVQELTDEVDDLKSNLQSLGNGRSNGNEDSDHSDGDDDDDDDDDDDESVCDGSEWSKKYFLLKEFKQLHGHCNVPSTYKDKKFFFWTGNLKKSYKTKKLPQGKVDKLTKLGFQWTKDTPPPPTWEERYEALKKHRDVFGDCKLGMDESDTSNMNELTKWVIEQRKQGRRLKKGKHSVVSPDQYKLLKEIHFIWKVPQKKKKNKRSL